MELVKMGGNEVKYYLGPTVSWKFMLNLGAISRSYDLKIKHPV